MTTETKKCPLCGWNLQNLNRFLVCTNKSDCVLSDGRYRPSVIHAINARLSAENPDTARLRELRKELCEFIDGARKVPYAPGCDIAGDLELILAHRETGDETEN